MQTNPWSNISSPSPGQFSVTRVETATTRQMFWFRDTDGSVGLLIEIHPSTSAAMLREANISICDVLIEIRHISDRGILALAVRLRDGNKSDIFLRLCLDLIDRVNNSTDNAHIFNMVCQRLKKWQSLFAGRTSGLLTSNEVQGLFAELSFLNELLDSGVISQEQVIGSWKGPERSHQDFLLNDTAVEIKSLTGQNRSKVRISSEDQLYSHLSRLFLRVYLLAEIYETSGGEGLNSLVRGISAKLIEESTKDSFESLLQMAGYIDLPEYDQPQFMVKNCYTYLISDHFPRIIQQTLPAGIQAVSYDVLLGAIEPFRVSEAKILEQ
jgi:Putative  PD-(D/E)XK family member, (DUF4420)